MKKLFFYIFISGFLTQVSQAEISVVRIDNTYVVKAQNEALISLKEMLIFSDSVVQLKEANWQIMTFDFKSDSANYGTFHFGGLDQNLL